VVITEIGGTVGDIESLPFLEAIRQVASDVGRENVVTYMLPLSLTSASRESLRQSPPSTVSKS